MTELEGAHHPGPFSAKPCAKTIVARCSFRGGKTSGSSSATDIVALYSKISEVTDGRPAPLSIPVPSDEKCANVRVAEMRG
jgi:hypothetical protein